MATETLAPTDLRAKLAALCGLGRFVDSGRYYDNGTKVTDACDWLPDHHIAQAFMCEAAMIARGWESEHWLNVDGEYVWCYRRPSGPRMANAKGPATAIALAIYRALEAEESETCP